MLLRIDSLTKTYKHFKVLDQFKMKLEINSFNLLTGENGSGKSTLLKCITGFETEYSGRIYINEKAIDHHDISNRLSFGIAYLPQETWLIPDITVKETLDLAFSLRKNDSQNIFLLEYTDFFIPERIKKTKVFHLSLGERRKLEFYLALLFKARIYLLDEPFSNWSQQSKITGMKILRKIIDDKATILMIEHKIETNTESLPFNQIIEIQKSQKTTTQK